MKLSLIIHFQSILPPLLKNRPLYVNFFIQTHPQHWWIESWHVHVQGLLHTRYWSEVLPHFCLVVRGVHVCVWFTILQQVVAITALCSQAQRESLYVFIECIYWSVDHLPNTFFASWVMDRSDMQRHNLPEFRLMLKVILKCYSVWSCEIAAVAYMGSDQGAHSNIKLIHSYASRLMERSACLKGD